MNDIKKPDNPQDEQKRTLESLRKIEERLTLAIEVSGARLWD